MVEKFLEELVKKLVANPAVVQVSKQKLDEQFYELVIHAAQGDAGRLIGKDGKMINAIKTLIAGFKAKNGESYRISVQPLQ